MDFKNVIIMSDLDGTLLTDDKKILPEDMEAVNRFRDGGGIFTLATGRGYSMAKPVAERIGLDVPAVIFNGSAVYDFSQNKFLWHSALNENAKKNYKRADKGFSRYCNRGAVRGKGLCSFHESDRKKSFGIGKGAADNM